MIEVPVVRLDDALLEHWRSIFSKLMSKDMRCKCFAALNKHWHGPARSFLRSITPNTTKEQRPSITFIGFFPAEAFEYPEFLLPIVVRMTPFGGMLFL
jgi:hypothetical protein